MKIKWKYNPGSKIQAPLYYFGDYVISERTNLYTLSYRPTNQHIPLGQFETLEQAKEIAQRHLDKNLVKEQYCI